MRFSKDYFKWHTIRHSFCWRRIQRTFYLRKLGGFFLGKGGGSHSRILCFLFGGFVPIENFSLMWRRHHADEGLQILTYTRHLRPLSTEGILACPTYCSTGHPFKMVISENPWHSYLLPSVWQWSCHDQFLWLGSVTAGIRTPNLPLVGRTPLQTAPPPRLTTREGLQF